MGRSLNTQFECLNGDFGWYSDFASSERLLSSGIPRYVVTIWFYSFIVFMVLVLLNMLLAIVMDHYMTLLTESRRDPANSPALWTQIHRQYLRWKEQKDFIPNFIIEAGLKDNTHEDEYVSVESMIATWPEMEEKQANTLVDWLQKEANNRYSQADDESDSSDSLELRRSLEVVTDRLRLVVRTSMKCISKVENFELNLNARLSRVETTC